MYIVDIETEGLDLHTRINYIGVGNKKTKKIFRFPEQKDECVVYLNSLLSLGEKFGYHGGKFDTVRILRSIGVDLPIHHDSLVLGYLYSTANELKENKKKKWLNLKKMAVRLLGVEDWDIDLDNKKSLFYEHELIPYLEKDLDMSHDLIEFFRTHLDPKHFGTYKLILKALNAFKYIELNGIPIDLKMLAEAKKVYEKEQYRLEEELKKHANINYRSSKQLAELLYSDLELPMLKKSNKGNPSADKESLVFLKGQHKVVDLLLEYRKAYKAYAFLKDWEERHINGRLYGTFNLVNTVSGRTSCSEPNLQQIPRNKTIKSVFRSTDPEWVMVQLDYSQLELRVAAMVANVKEMKEAYKRGEDLHTKMAMIITGKEKSEITKEDRTSAKAANFGYLYGMSADTFVSYAKINYGVDLTLAQARMIRDDFFKLFNELPAYYRRTEDELYSKFELKTIMNRYYRLTSKYYSKRERGEYLRSGTNATVQSPANDIVLCGIIEVVETLPNDKFRICATVHDSIIAEVRKDSLHLVKQAQAIMEHPKLVKEFLIKDFELDVELKVDIEIGPWGMGIPYEQYVKENNL